jgi:hypothetical protein
MLGDWGGKVGAKEWTGYLNKPRGSEVLVVERERDDRRLSVVLLAKLFTITKGYLSLVRLASSASVDQGIPKVFLTNIVTITLNLATLK